MLEGKAIKDQHKDTISNEKMQIRTSPFKD